MIQLELDEIKKQKNLVVLWGITFMVLFPVLIIFGLLMRLSQGDITSPSPGDFYAYMTFHGLGMAGTLYSFAFAGLWYMNATKLVKLNIKVGYFIYGAILVGVVGLLFGVIIEKYAPGWYMLYPMPFKGTSWTTGATTISVISLIILGVAWLVGILHILFALSKEYAGFTNLLGWQYLKKQEVTKELHPLALITMISLLPGLFAIITGAALLIMYLIQSLEPSMSYDALLMKNMVMFFGHTLVNITLYCCLGWVYTLLPEFTHREWKVNKVLVYSWNATFIAIVFAFFHHLYMDFSQNLAFHYVGQFASYLSPIPATGITMFGVVAQIYHSKMKWTIVPVSFLIGTAGWATGGLAAVIDSTIAVNRVLHNTLWVPAHFHSYMLMGVVLFILGFLFYIFYGEDKNKSDKIAQFGFWTFIVGAYGFVLMFYLGGFNSVPRRYSSYVGIDVANVHSTGALLAVIASVFIVVLLIGLLAMYISLFKNLKENRATV